MTIFKTTLVAGVFAVAASAVAAQDIYGGVALDYGKPHAGDDQVAASLLLGAGFGAVGPIGFGIEADYGTTTAGTGGHDTGRLRLMGTYDFGGVALLGSIGGTMYDAGADNFTGYNFGLGAQAQMTDSLDIRGEFIRDMMGDDFGTDVTTTRVAVIYSF